MMQLFFTRCLLFSKRLFKKPSFIILLLLIPVAVFLMGNVAQQKSGFVRIVLVAENPSDAATAQTIDYLTQSDSLIYFTIADKTSAMTDLKENQADCVWVFPDDMQSRIEKYVDNPSEFNYVVSVYERTETTISKLSREKLVEAMYELFSKEIYLNHINCNVDALSHLSDEQLLSYYEQMEVEGDIFSFDEVTRQAKEAKSNYLTAPIRGLLSVMVALCGLAVVMYNEKDRENGTFSACTKRVQFFIGSGNIILALTFFCIVCILSLSLAGLFDGIAKELFGILILILCTFSFCTLLNELIPNKALFCATIPVLTIGMIAVCPVFMQFKSVRELSFLLPPTYYLNSFFYGKFYVYGLAYSLIALALAFATNKIKTIVRMKKKQYICC